MSSYHVCYIRLTRRGPAIEDERRVLERRGIDLSGDLAPLYVDEPPKSSSSAIAMEKLPQLQEALRSLRPSEVLAVPDLGTFATHMLWTQVCRKVELKGATILDARSGCSYAPAIMADFLAGQELVIRLAHERKTAAARQARAERGIKGGAKRKLTPANIKTLASTYWPDPNAGSNQAIADSCEKLFGVKVSKATLERRMKEFYDGADRTTVMNRAIMAARTE